MMTSEDGLSSGSQVQKLLAEEGALSVTGQLEDAVLDSGRDSPLTSYPAVLTLAEVEDLAGNLEGEDQETRTQILKAIALLLVIKQSFDAGDLLRTIRKLYSLLQKATSGLIRFMENNQTHLPVIAAMKHMPHNSAIQQISCQFLCLCAEKCEALFDGLVRCNFHKDLIQVIHHNITDPVIQQSGMKMFAMLLRSATVREQLRINDEDGQAPHYDEEVLHLIAVAIPAFRDDSEIQIAAAKALALLLDDDPDYQEQFMTKSLIIVLEVLKASSDVDVQIHLLSVFKLLARNEAYRDTLVCNDLHLYLMDVCKTYPEKCILISEALKILSQLCKIEAVQEQVVNGFVEESLVPVLGQHRSNKDIQNSGLKIISYVGTNLFGGEIKDDLPPIIVHLLFEAMFIHLETANVQISCCKIIAVMLEYKQETQRWIGDNPNFKEEPVHNLCLGAMLMFRRNKAVFISACEAIYWMAADNDRLSSSLMTKNVHFAIIEGLKKFRKDSLAVETACKALRGLCIFNDLHKNVIVMDDTFGLLIDVLKRHKDLVAVQIEVIGAIACLSDVDLVRYQCYVQKVPEAVINSMKRYPEDDTLQETCLEALAMLAAAEQGAEILISAGIGPCVLNAMKTFDDNIYIIKKGLILLQLLACPTLLTKKHICKDISSIIHQAMTEYRDNPSVQTEAYVAIQLLAEAGTYMSELFVEEGCHEFLFEAINDSVMGALTSEKWSSETNIQLGLRDLYDVAGECFFVLCQEQNQKSKMLLSACRKGTLDVVKCLVEMNADVNVEENAVTPLYHSVCNQNEEMVRTLLKHDVRELIVPLKKSLQLGSHSITGHLLRQIGYDKESGGITWSSLGLERVMVEWILISITDPLTSEQETDSEKTYLMRLKTSEQKRKKRKLEYSKSDPTIRRRARPRLRHVSSTASSGIASDNEGNMTVPQTAAVTTNDLPLQYKVKRDFKRSLSVEVFTASGSSSSPMLIPRRPTLPTINSGKSQSPDDEDLPVFVMSVSEAEEFKKSTITGANVPYNPKDPRQEQRDVNKLEPTEVDMPWQRKRPRTPKDQQLMSSSSLSSDDFNPAAHMGRRKMSAPVLSSLQNLKQQYRRKCSIDSITDIEETVSKLTTHQLYSFDISDNKILTVESLSSTTLEAHFEKLEKLDLSSNNLKELPESVFKNMPSLQVLDVRCNQLEVFPVGVLQCENLKDLLLSRNKIPEMTLEHFNLSIKTLDMSYNKLTSLPSGIGNYFHKVKEMILNNNDIMALPETPLGLKELRRLDISHNQIDCIPENFLHTCSKLEVLEASFNHISHLPSEAVSSMLPKLNKLKLRRNSLATKAPYYFPKFILDLPGLRYLDMSENSLTGIPAIALWKSTMIKELICNKNKIQVLKLEGAKTWNKLEKFHVSHNCIKELPGEIGNFSSLSSLDISYNDGLTTLPDGLGKCSKMWELQLDGLDLDLDRALMQRRVKDIICYLHNRLKKSKRYYRMKLMVVGYGGRGKTTLLKTLMERNRKPRKSRENRPTVGVDVNEWKYKRYERRFSDDIDKSWASGGKSVEYTLSAWDFAGQEDFYSTHQCYLSNRAIYLVVFDLRNGVGDLVMLKIWLASIHSRAPGCPVIVVGTHKDKVSQDGAKAEEETKKLTDKLKEYRNMPGFPSIHGVFLVDATCENDDIDYLRNTIKYFIEEYRVRGKRVMGEKIPASYVQLSDLLLEEARRLQDSYPVIRHNRLLQIVRMANLDLDEDELMQAVSYLHESGVLLHYTDSTLHLRDFYFIDPGWLCKMMAQVITVKQINPFISRDGVLRKTDVEFLFRGKAKFPASLIPQYLKLLEKFEIALPHSDAELLIPCRLPEERPPDIHIPENGTGKIVRIYRMPYVPIGLWFRLISRMITLTANKAFQALLDISEPVIRNCWRRGLFIYWSKEQYILLDPVEEESDETEGIQIIVPSSAKGSRLLGQIVDHIDNLVDEWYPGLTSIDPILGHKVLEVEIPCAGCPDFDIGPERCHSFLLKEIQDEVEKGDFIDCPQHGGRVHISELAPDLVMSDLEPAFKLCVDEFEFEESSDKQLGDGGFGDVYTAKYKGKEVAVKVFKKIAEIHSLTMLRQEATILRCLNHPSIVSLVAVGIRPSVIVLELAPLGTLGYLVKKDTLGEKNGKFLQQRIALQVADGLMYLHKMMIIFRDMKPDNVLIFSLSKKAWMHAKISDYGIARFSAYEGLKAQEGTLAYRAPEVIRKENYSFEADVFSYGLTIYVMLAKRHPFDQLESKGEMDRAIAEGLTIPPLEGKGIPEWPDMHAIVMQCLNHDPSLRPTARQVVETMQAPDMLCLKKMVYVSKSTTVECFAIQLDREERQMSLWIASGDCSAYQLSKYSLSDPGARSKGTNFNHGRILCMQALLPHYLALGTQFGRVWLYDTHSNELKHSSAQLQDSVLCMKQLIGPEDTNLHEEGGMLLVGLANGKIGMFPVSEFIQEENVDPICLYPGHDYEPVVCMVRMGKRAFVSCGTQILILNCTSRGIAIETIANVDSKRPRAKAPIYTLCVTKGAVLFTRMNSPDVEIWDSVKEKVRDSFSMDTLFGIPKTDARVTALVCTSRSNTVWVGTHGGHIGLVDFAKLEPITLTHRHVRSVRCLVYVKDFGFTREQVVLSGGLGFRDLPGQEVDKSSLCGCVAIWNSGMASEARTSAEYEKKRKETRDKRSQNGSPS